MRRSTGFVLVTRPRFRGLLPGVIKVCSLLAVVAVTGCAADTAGAAGAAEEFRRAAADGDPSVECSMLSPHTRAKVAGGTSCEDRLASLQLPSEGTALRTERFGRNAMVVFPDDTVFLTVSGSAWQVTGAGCTANGDAPYDCDVGG